MKRVIFIFVILFFYFIIINKKIETTFIEKIDLNLLEDEVAVVFLSSNNYKTILLHDNDMDSLIVLDVNDSKRLVKNLNKFMDKKLDNLFILDNDKKNIDIDYNVKDILNNSINMGKYKINKNDNIIEISNNKYNLCIYDTGLNNDISKCDFIYFINMDIQLNMKESLRAVFYEKNIASKFKENTYIKWIDNYELSSDTYNILKLSNDSYDVITLPNEN